MPLEPFYTRDVDQQLDAIENDDSRRPLWNAIATTLNLICDKPDGRRARFKEIRTRGDHFWLVPVKVQSENEDWAILWQPDGPDARFVYVGLWPPV